MIKNTVIHLAGEQPLLADLYRMPDPGDVALVCTNLRQKNGERPIFADEIGSTFVFPLVFVRFVEIPAAAMVGAAMVGAATSGPAAGVLALGAGRGEEAAAAAGAASAAASAGPAAEPGADADLEIDEDFLRRIRDV
jgi:hypothetical protein